MVTDGYNKNTDIIDPFIGAFTSSSMVDCFDKSRMKYFAWLLQENFWDKIQFSRNVVALLVHKVFSRMCVCVCVCELCLIRVMNGCNNEAEDWWLLPTR